MWVAGRPETCNLETATSLSFDAFLRGHRRLRGRCVAVRGWWLGRTLLRRPPEPQELGQTLSARMEGERIGVYGRPEDMERAPHRPEPYTLVGIAGDCETLGAGAMMVMGYCHYASGPYIAVAEAHSRR